MDFIKMFTEKAVNMPNHPILADDSIPNGLTYEQVDGVSGKVFAYLQSKGIGKEDFVLICLPRSIKPLIAILGVWKNGSAFALVENNYAPERIEFIKKDCGCKLVIDLDVWEEIQTFPVKPGYIETEPHDAAFAVYTSGTTGNPKGVLHEYGNIDRMVLSTDLHSCDKISTDEDRFALAAPLNFIATLLIMVTFFKIGTFLYVVSYKTLKNPMLLGMFISTAHITGTFLTPSHIRKVGDKLPKMKFCCIGSEPANEVFVDGLLIHNFYLMSESGFAVTHFLIDHIYQQTPAGDSEFGHKLYLLDENGNEVPDGEAGEICFENDFVRGYINLPEQSAEAFKDTGDGRGRLYYTGDLARRDEKGRIVICGRLSDMVKINGNRVEPGEIEEVARKVLNVEWTAVRIFDENSRVFIALYYMEDIAIDEEKLRKEMERFLPYYMIPSFFIRVDSVPLKATGKMDRKALPKPDFDSYRSDYEEPRDDIEKALCDAFAEVLQMDKFGIHDDFYKLGGDSLTSIEATAKSKLPGLQSSQIFRGHTVEKIAELYKKESADFINVDIEAANKEALSQAHPLTPEQLYMFDYQLYSPKSTMYNLYQMIKLDKSVLDMEKVAQAINTTVRNHPALQTVFFFNEDGFPMQKYCPEKWQDIVPEYISEEEFDALKDDLVQPFNRLVNSLLFRCRLFVTEKAGYLFLDVHHTLFDGTSSKVLYTDFLNTYFGKPLDPDYYYYNIRKREENTWTPFYKESKEYFEKKYFTNGIEWQRYPKLDRESRANENDEILLHFPIDQEDYERTLEKTGITPNAFFITANILATAFYNRYRHIMISWIYNARGNVNELLSVGLMFVNLPVAISLTPEMKITELYTDIVDQINNGIEHCCYPPIASHANVYVGDTQCVLFQDELRELIEMPGLIGEVEIKRNKGASQSVLDTEILKSHEGLEIMLDYSSNRYDKQTMKNFFNTIVEIAVALRDCAGNEESTVLDVLKEAYKEMNGEAASAENDLMAWLKEE